MKARVNQRKMIQKKISVLIRKKPKTERNQEITRGCAMNEAMFCYFCRKSKRTNPLHEQTGVQISVHLKIKMSPKNVHQNFSQGDKLSPHDQILQLKSWTYVDPLPRGPLIKDLYRRHKNTKSSAFPSTIYHIVRPLVREGHSHEGATKF